VDVDVEDLLEEADVEGEEESRSERRARIWGFSLVVRCQSKVFSNLRNPSSS